MRIEATTEEWKKLYDITSEIKSLEPWNYLWDTDLISIMLPARKEPLYCSIIGRGGECYGVNVFDGYLGLNDFLSISEAERNRLSIEYIMFEISNLSCNFGNRDEVPAKQKKVIKEIEYSFRGKNQWIYFETYKKGYVPYLPSHEEVCLLTACYESLSMVLREFIDNKIEVDFDAGYTLSRRYDESEKSFIIHSEPLPFHHWRYPIINLRDEVLKMRLKKLPTINAVLELDVQYLPTLVKDKKYDRPVRPKIILLMDSLGGTILSKEVIGPKDDEVNMILNVLVRFMIEHGKMVKLYYSKPQIEGIIGDLAKGCRLSIHRVSNLKAVDAFVKELFQFI